MKRPKLYTAYEGDAAGLRDVLIDYFKREHDNLPKPTGATWEDGNVEGRGAAYSDIIIFLKKLVINEAEHVDDPPV
jgi:hypothetical protein